MKVIGRDTDAVLTMLSNTTTLQSPAVTRLSRPIQWIKAALKEFRAFPVQIDEALWVIHAFQKKSTRGIKTPKHEIDLIADRVKRLKQMAKEIGK